jgi:hypothetical protein
MLSKEFITEGSAISPFLVQDMKRKGYTLMGKGQDMQAWLEPRTGFIVKIFGSNLYGDNRAQQSFKHFATYCMRHKDNPFLPNIIEWKPFTFQEEDYLLIKMERLFPLKGQFLAWGEALEMMSEAAEHDGSARGKQKFLDEFMSKNGASEYENNEVAEIITHIGQEGFDHLWKALADLAKIATQYRYIYDLHAKNFMLGSDGHIVISDPFYTP